MSFQAMTVALAIDVPATQKSLLLCLANYVNEQNKFWPSYNTLANDSGMCRRTVISHMKKFVELGVVSKQTVMSSKGNQSNLYTFKGVQYLKKEGYIIELTDTGYIKITKPQPNEIEGCNVATPLVQDDHPPGDPVAPNPISEPIKEPITKEPCANELAPIENQPSNIELAFDKTWAAWHNKKNRIEGKKVFTKLCKDNPTTQPGFIADSLIADFTERLELGIQGFDKIHFKTYINGKRWEDDKTVANPQSQNKRVDPLLKAMGLA